MLLNIDPGYSSHLLRIHPTVLCNQCHCVCVIWGSSDSEFPSGFNLTSDLPILKGTSLLFLQAAVVTSFFCDHSLSVLLRSTGLNDCHTMLHCPQTCDVGAQESHGGGPLCTFQAQTSISVIPSQIFLSLHICEPSVHPTLYTHGNPGHFLPGLFIIDYRFVDKANYSYRGVILVLKEYFFQAKSFSQCTHCLVEIIAVHGRGV